MKLKKIKITPEIKLYYSDQEPDWDLVKSASRIFTGSIEPVKTKHRHQVYMLEHNNEVYYVKKFPPLPLSKNSVIVSGKAKLIIA